MDAPELTHMLGVCLGIILLWLIKSKRSTSKQKTSVYGLQHGKLHLQVPTAMWMNMGYWKDVGASSKLSEACRRLLEAILIEAGFSRQPETHDPTKDTRPIRCLVDLGIGCGDQTICLMSDKPVRPSDKEWWNERGNCANFDYYVGITKDEVQARYASERVEELKRTLQTSDGSYDGKESKITVACADAAAPNSWNAQLRERVHQVRDESDERWVLALDTAYHFSPSRWPLIQYTHSELKASFMAFDLCLSPSATFAQKTLLRLLTALMGAPWKNFVTPEQYRQRLVEIGYDSESITMKDISEHVFTPLATFLEQQDQRLKMIGLGIGSFGVARTMFKWWGRTGLVRGVIIVAKYS